MTSPNLAHDLELLEARPLEAGKTYVLQLTTQRTSEEMQAVGRALAAIAERTGCDFMVMDAQMRLVEPLTPGCSCHPACGECP